MHKIAISYMWSISLFADGRQTAGLVIQPYQTIAEDICIWSVRPKQCESLFNCALEIVLAYL